MHTSSRCLILMTRFRTLRSWLLMLPIVLMACDASSHEIGSETSDSAPLTTGAAWLAQSDFELLHGRNVGLIVNHTAMVDSVHLIDLLHEADGVELVALFGPEHGLRGELDAGARVEDGRDPRTGVPIYSLYGDTRRPTPEMLADLDVLIFDIQDVGSRFYTYISTMGLAMQAANEAGIPFIVLDRPNPLGGEYVSGFVLEPEFESFVGQYPIPTAHGLSVGELARLVQGEAMLPGLENLDLTVVEMQGWDRDMLWADTGLEWNPPSPNIPDFEIALIYAGTCLFEGVSASEGRGTYEPFKTIGAPFGDASDYAAGLNAIGLAGVEFRAHEFTPQSIEGMSSSPKLLGEDLEGVQIDVTDMASFEPVEAGIHVLHAFYDAAPDKDAFLSRRASLDRLAGTDRLRSMLVAGASAQEIIDSWQDEVVAFRELRAAYLIY